VREPLANSVYRDLGIPASESRLLRLDVNGELWGVFAEAEQPNKDFLKKWKLEDTQLFKAVSGSHRSDQRDLGSPRAYARDYQNETGEEDDFDSLHAFCHELETSADKEAFFKEYVNLTQFTNYLCANAVLQHWDSFSKNHFIAKESTTNHWMIIPWDLDRTLGDHWYGGF
jgi:spore coat protein CotH